MMTMIMINAADYIPLYPSDTYIALGNETKVTVPPDEKHRSIISSTLSS